MSHDDDHKRGKSDKHGSFAAAAKDAVGNYEAWCKQHGKTPVDEAEIEFRVGIKKDSSLSEYIAILHIDD